MKTVKIFTLLLLVFITIFGCNNKIKPSDGTVKDMEDLVVSQNFNWKTTKTISANIKVPVDESNQLLRIYSIDNKNLLYAGYANPGSGMIQAKLTVPTSYNMVKLVYGQGNRYKDILVGIGNDLYYDYNAFKTAEAGATTCDLSGFLTYSQGGWSSSPHGHNPGTVLDAHFSETFPQGLVIGDPDHNTITLTSAEAVRHFLPGGGHSIVLNTSYTNPTRHQRVGGNWAGQIAAAVINVEFDKRGFLGNNNLKLGDLVFKDGPFEDMSINDFLILANKALGGGGLSGYTIEQIANAAELINVNFDEGTNLHYFTCPPNGSPDECGCKKGLQTLTMRYNGTSPAQIVVKERHNQHEIYSGTVEPGGTFTFHGSGHNNRMGINIDFYINGTKNTSIHTSCSVNLYKGDVYGQFTIVDGISKNGLHLCALPADACGCKDQMYALTMRYDGNSTAQVVVKEKRHHVVIYCGIVSPGTEFSFNGSDNDGKIYKTIYFYVDGVRNATMSTRCKDDIKVGNHYGDFTLIAGTSEGNKPLCNGDVTPPPGGSTSVYKGSLAYEDLWPYKGDYDFNDLVIDYNFAVSKDAEENVQNITATFIIYAFGASFHNGFGFQLPNVKPNQIIRVTGSDLAPNSIFTLTSNGLEAGQSKATAIVYDDSWRLMPYPGTGIGINTEMEAPFVTPDTIVMQMVFYENGAFAPGGPVKFNTLDIGNFNPFLVVNQQRGIEVHLPDKPPTDLADTKLLGTGDDNSIPANDRFYKTDKNLPWAINIPVVFTWPIEKEDITHAYNHFADWAESSGELYPDWYEDKPGYRNNDVLYTKHR
jgi:LruC domain-containing protein